MKEGGIRKFVSDWVGAPGGRVSEQCGGGGDDGGDDDDDDLDPPPAENRRPR